MSDLLLKNVILDKKNCDVLIQNGIFKTIAPSIKAENARIFDGKGKLGIFPAFYNNHTHTAMTLFRSAADDLELFDWLSNHIWPAEARLTAEDVYWGSMLGMIEMIRSGSVSFNDTYWYQLSTVRAAEELGMRGTVGMLMLENAADSKQLENDLCFARRNDHSSLVKISVAPHAIYTVSEKNLRRAAEIARAEDMLIHIHVSETAREVEDCRREHNGLTPVEYLEKCGLVTAKSTLAHCLHLTDNDIKIIADCGSFIASCPCSGMKLTSGRFAYHRAVELGNCNFTIGTDGASSNNSLSMFDEIKLAAISAKLESQLPTSAEAADIFYAATRGGALAAGVDGGLIEEGKAADCQLIDLDSPCMAANFNPVSDMVYSADPSCVDTVICNGRIIMEHRHIDGEEEIIGNYRRIVKNIMI